MRSKNAVVRVSSACISVHLRQNSFSTKRSGPATGPETNRAAGPVTSNEDHDPLPELLGEETGADWRRAVGKPLRQLVKTLYLKPGFAAML